MQLDEIRKQSFCDYSNKYYDGLLESWLDKIQPILMKCESCGHIFYKNVPDKDMLGEMYASVKRSSLSPDPSRSPNKEMLLKMSKLKNIVSKKNPTFLDYGAGYGRWSEAAFQVGFNVISFEPHANRANKDCKYEVIYEESLLEERKFDVIWLEQVLEHIPNPADALIKIKRYMNADSILSLSVPNINRAKERNKIWELWPYNGSSSHTLAPYQHLHGFSQMSLEQLVIMSGYTGFYSRKLLRYDLLHVLRIIIGRHINSLSTTKRYLKLQVISD